MIPLRAQTMADATKVWIDEWKYAFSSGKPAFIAV